MMSKWPTAAVAIGSAWKKQIFPDDSRERCESFLVSEEVERWMKGREEFANHRVFKTSGSTGRPKWVALSAEALEWSARSVIESQKITPDDVLGLALPTHHVGGYGVIERARLSGAGLAKFSAPWEASKFCDWLRTNGVSILSLVPTQVHDLAVADCRPPSSLRLVIVGGGAISESLMAKARELGWPVVPSYGMTETSSQVATGDCLPLLPGWQARITEDGRLALKGGGLLTAIIREEKNGFVAEDPKVDGWFVTSDRAVLEDRKLKILGRSDRRIKILGELIDLDQLEKFWTDKLGSQAALIAIPDARRVHLLHLSVEGSTDLVAGVNSSLPGPERISSWKTYSDLPRTPLGKIDRAALLENLENRCHP